MLSMDDTCYSSTSHGYEEHDESMKDCEFFVSESDDNRNHPYMIRWKSGKRVDPRLLTMLETFKKLYEEKRELFKKIFPEIYNEFVDVFKKLGEMTENNKEAETMEQSRTLERSLSFGSPLASSRGLEMDDKFVNEKFKVRPPTVILDGSGGKAGQTVQGDAK